MVLCSQNKDTKILGRENCTLRVGVVFLALVHKGARMSPARAEDNTDLYSITDTDAVLLLPLPLTNTHM